ncbi:MAG TPA: DoxX family protein [Thermoanaerobaculia bacterium]|jgi:putative oxidoreductase
MSVSSLTLKTTALAERVFAPFGNVVLLVLRLVWGWQFLTTGLGKLENHTRVTDFFTSLGIPAPGLNAWFIGGLEMVGGALLLLGLLSRPIALLLTGNMLVAYLTADRPALLGVFHDLDAFLRADPFWFLFVSVVVLTLGPGAISLDRLLAKVLAERREPASR